MGGKIQAIWFSGVIGGPVVLGGGRGFTSQNPRCLRTYPSGGFFYDFFVVDKIDEYLVAIS